MLLVIFDIFQLENADEFHLRELVNVVAVYVDRIFADVPI
jgi:hypothetical protein